MKINVNFYGSGHGARRRGRIVFSLGLAHEQAGPAVKTPKFFRCIKEDVDMASALTVTQQVTVTIKAIKDKKGNPAKIDGAPAWATDNTDLLALTPAADGMSCLVKAVGVIGSANVQASIDADVGPGVSLVLGTAGFDIVAGQAVQVDLDVGAPAEQP